MLGGTCGATLAAPSSSVCVGRCPQVEHEIALHSRLRHRNIVAFHGHFADRDHVYMVLEYCSHQVI
jgi:serine/threonine protein kinase